MTEEIIIDGVNVAGCEYMLNNKIKGKQHILLVLLFKHIMMRWKDIMIKLTIWNTTTIPIALHWKK